MADTVDITQDTMEFLREIQIAVVRERAAKIPAGVPGECDLCGEWSGRLVKRVCARCRDKNKLL